MTRKILVLEDSPTQAERVRLLLEGEGFQVDVAPNGREGLERLAREVPDLIISDVMMPEMDGYAFCQAVKSDPKTKRIPVVLLTQQNSPEDILRGLERGADNFITKPFEDEYLLARVKRILENLELRERGRLEMEVTLRVANRDLTITTDKQQIVELLFATFDDLCRVNHQLTDSQRKVEERTREVQAANVRLEEASRYKSEFLANMSHELRTPLNSILGFSELLETQTYGPLNEKQSRHVRNILSSGRHLLALINDILDLSKVEAGKLVLEPTALDVAATLEEILVIARGLAHKKAQSIESEIAPNLPPLRADPVRFKQIVFNLLSNAVKFTPEQGRITLAGHRASGATECLELRVTDTGTGIKAEDLPRLFQEFVQLEAMPGKRHEGTGLGLALSKRLVELHGGRIWATSAGEGRGSTFTFILPLAGPGAPVEASAAARSS
ncbi:MAG TPA: ATP-binding protein [Candidatus Methylomirabilis sp.]|nr:ATP-binding protein [Candidatus Methylomirabilis sp.]